MNTYLAVFLALLAAGFGAPVPEELPVVAAGVLSGQAGGGHPLWYVLLPVCVAGVVAADFALYAAGRLWGPGLLDRPWVARHVLPPDRRRRFEELFRRHGVLVLLAVRLMPGVRTAAFLTAGVVRVPVGRFLLADGLYAIPGVGLLFGLAFAFSDPFRACVERLTAARWWLVAALAVAAVWVWWRHRPVDPPGPGRLQ